MRPVTFRKSLPILCACALLLSPARAVEVRFTGEITSFGAQNESGDELAKLLPIGLEITGRASYRPDAELLITSTFSTHSESIYRGSGMSMELGDIRISTPGHEITVIDGPEGGLDQLTMNSNRDITSSGSPMAVLIIGFGLQERTGTIFNSTALPSGGLTLSDFAPDSAGISISFVRDPAFINVNSAFAQGRFTSLTISDGAPISEPSTIALLCLGALGLAASGTVLSRSDSAINRWTS